MRRVLCLSSCVAVLVVAGCATYDDGDRAKAESHRDLGDLYMQRNEVEMAIREFRVALNVFEPDPLSHFAIGEAYRRKREYELAETHLKRALDLDPELLDARLNLGVLYLEQERWAEAIRENQLLIEDPTFLVPARALVNGGWAHYKSGDLEGAERLFRQAVGADGSSFQARLNLGIVLYEQNETVDAVREFEKAIELLEGRPPALYSHVTAQTRFRAAMAHIRLGQRSRAIAHLQAAAEWGGETEWGVKSREYLAVLE
jgi:type IV pilus assembly protein PilF